MPRKSKITVTSRADTAKTRNAALARRLASGNPFAAGTKSIPLKEPHRWHTYIANTYVDDSAFYEMRRNGWEPLLPEDLGCPIEESGFTVSVDGHLVRGPRGQEMIFKMDADDYRLLERAKTERNMASIGSRSKTKNEMANAAGKQLGDEAGSFINGLQGEVIDRITGGDAA